MNKKLSSPKKKRISLGAILRRAGFDLTTYNRKGGYYRTRCSQCEASVIQGLATHETGCPNQRKQR